MIRFGPVAPGVDAEVTPSSRMFWAMLSLIVTLRVSPGSVICFVEFTAAMGTSLDD
jgi:hypothetical protein